MDALSLSSLADKAKAKKEAAKNRPQPTTNGGKLSQKDIKDAKGFFQRFDRDDSNAIDVWELSLALKSMGTCCHLEEAERLMERLDTDGNKKLNFAEFLVAYQMQLASEKHQDAEQDLLDAFVAMGGQPDKSGFVNAEQLRKVIRDDYGLNLKVEDVLEELDRDQDGEVNYEEFARILT